MLVRLISLKKDFKDIIGVFDSDSMGEIKDKSYSFKVLEYNKKINDINLIKGRKPQKDNECMIEENKNIKIGDEITLDSNFYKDNKLKVVGIIESPLYLSVERDKTKIGNGQIDYYIYVHGKNIISDKYTSIYTTLKTDFNTFSNNYNKEIKKFEKKYDEIGIEECRE